MSENNKKTNFLFKVLNGLSMGIVIALIPGVILGEFMKLFIGILPFATDLILISTLIVNTLPAIAGFCIAQQFKLPPIESASVAIATVLASGVATLGANNKFIFSGTGDIINIGLAAALTVFILQLLGNRFKSARVLITPLLALIPGIIGIFTLPYVSLVTTYIGKTILSFTILQPILMCILISVSFTYIVVSPVSTVAVALAIQLSGIGSGAASLGVASAAFGLGIAGMSVNSFGTTIVHFVGSPKIQMSNLIRKPAILIPASCTAIILGALTAILNIQGTPYSAGFGIAGLAGPINAYNLFGNDNHTYNLMIVILVYAVLPLILAIFFHTIFTKIVKIVKPEDYRVDFD